jgi:hypothetical protein
VVSVTLVKKGSRVLDVDGVMYRWRLRGRPTYSQGLGSRMTYAVELAEEPGATLVVTTSQAHPSNWVNKLAVPILPRHVGRAVRRALAQGWLADSPGKPFPLTVE